MGLRDVERLAREEREEREARTAGLRNVERLARKEREERTAAGRTNFNADKTRYMGREFLGWVCYAGSTGADGQFRGKRVGVTATEADAQLWLEGKDDIQWDIPADPAGNLVDTHGSER